MSKRQKAAEGDNLVDATGLVLQCQQVSSSMEAKSTDIVAPNASQHTEQGLDTKLNTLNQHMSDLQQEIRGLQDQMTALKTAMNASEKKRALEFAFENAHFGSYRYNTSSSSNKESKDLVKSIVLAFRRGLGHYLPEGGYLQSIKWPRQCPENEKQFRDALLQQLSDLIGQSPRLVQEGDRYIIHYS